jgi:hypothetical protein
LSASGLNPKRSISYLWTWKSLRFKISEEGKDFCPIIQRQIVGGLFVLLIYATLMANGLRIAYMARDLFGLLFAVGISVMFFGSRVY